MIDLVMVETRRHVYTVCEYILVSVGQHDYYTYGR